MTKIECLEKMLLVWRYLEKHPEVCKKEKPYPALNLLHEGHDSDCNLCSLMSFWFDSEERSNIFCEANNSQYNRWKSIDLRVRAAAAAKEIADYAEQLFNEIKEGKAEND